MQLNTRVKSSPIKTHENGAGIRLTPEQQLSRTLMSCMLWEDTFYEDGESIADRLGALMLLVDPTKVRDLVLHARNQMKLRHAPLFLTRKMAKYPQYKNHVADLLENIIQRPAELCEAVAMYWKEKKEPLSAQYKKGLARAFAKFNSYQLAKYNRDNAIKLRDVLFLCHAKPKDEEQAVIWKALINGTLESPDTWEVALSCGADKKESWSRLLTEKKLGSLALIRNLRNMIQAQVEIPLIRKALRECNPSKLWPFQLIGAAKYAPQFEPEIETLLGKLMDAKEKLSGTTLLLVDVSCSMDGQLSLKGERTRLDAACGLAMIAREICEDIRIWTFSNRLVLIPPRRGFALRDIIVASQPHGNTLLGGAIKILLERKSFEPYDRLICITDEQAADSVLHPESKAYMLNVAPYQNAVGYGKWVRIDGWSENCIQFIRASEGLSLELGELEGEGDTVL